VPQMGLIGPRCGGSVLIGPQLYQLEGREEPTPSLLSAEIKYLLKENLGVGGSFAASGGKPLGGSMNPATFI